MRIKCISGYYKFYKDDTLDLARAKDLFNIDLVPCEDHYTFSALRDMKKYSVIGYPVGLGIAKVTTAGEKWEILKRNLLVYNILLGNITELALSIKPYTVPVDTGKYAGFTSIPQAGGLLNGIPFTSFNASVDFKTGLVRVGEVGLW